MVNLQTVRSINVEKSFGLFQDNFLLFKINVLFPSKAEVSGLDLGFLGLVGGG